jgi:hypothetical protein
MESVSNNQFKSPVKKLVTFFRASRDKWKERYLLKRDESILLANKVRAVEKSRQRWSEVARAARLEVKQVKAELQRVTEELKKICD